MYDWKYDTIICNRFIVIAGKDYEQVLQQMGFFFLGIFMGRLLPRTRLKEPGMKGQRTFDLGYLFSNCRQPLWKKQEKFAIDRSLTWQVTTAGLKI